MKYYFIVCKRIRGDWKSKDTKWRDGSVSLCKSSNEPLMYEDMDSAILGLTRWVGVCGDCDYFIVDVDTSEIGTLTCTSI